jgi:integrase
MASYEKRGASTRAVVRLAGGGKVMKTFDTLAEAKQWGEATERTKSADGGQRSSTVTVADMFEAYDNAVASKTDSAKWNALRIRNFCKHRIASLKVQDVITHDINEWISDRLVHVCNATVNRELTLMSGAFAYAQKDRKWIKVNPCVGSRKPEEGKARDRELLSPLELASLSAAAGYSEDDDLTSVTCRVFACFLLALETGVRSGEILRLLPSDYWRDKRTLHVGAREAGGRKSAKSGRSTKDPSRNVPLTQRAIDILDRLLLTKREGQRYIVGIKDTSRDAMWRKIRERSGVENINFHDSKHEAATRLSKYIDVIALSHAIGTKDLRLLRDTYYNNDASRSAALLPAQLTPQ